MYLAENGPVIDCNNTGSQAKKNNNTFFEIINLNLMVLWTSFVLMLISGDSCLFTHTQPFSLCLIDGVFKRSERLFTTVWRERR